MRKKSYAVALTATEREQLKDRIAAGKAPARKLTQARILLKADEGPGGPAWVEERIADALETSQPTLSLVRKQYVQEGLAAALRVVTLCEGSRVEDIDRAERHLWPSPCRCRGPAPRHRCTGEQGSSNNRMSLWCSVARVASPGAQAPTTCLDPTEDPGR